MLVQYAHQSDPNVADDRYYYVHDRLGSVRLVVDANSLAQTVTARNVYTYSPFGNPYAGTVTEAVYNPFQFTGQWFDCEINQYYLRARQYDPTMMRFTARDSVRGSQEEPLTLHKYLYCANEPLSRVDPMGRSYAAGLVEPIMAGHSVHAFARMVTAVGVAEGNWNIMEYGFALEKTILPVMAIVMGRSHFARPDKRTWDLVKNVNDDAGGNLMGGGGPNWWGRLPKWARIGTGVAILSGSPLVIQGVIDFGFTVWDWVFGGSEDEYHEQDAPPKIGSGSGSGS